MSPVPVRLGACRHALDHGKRLVPLAALSIAACGSALAVPIDSAGPTAAQAPGHGTPILPILFGLVVIIAGAKLGGSLLTRMGQPAVLGELIVGMILGNLGLVGFHGLDWLRELEGIELLAEIGVLFLLFEVGLHSNLPQLLATGTSSLLVATIGVVAPMVLGYVCSALFFPESLGLTHWFVGAMLCATSVGITARVLKDIRQTESAEGRIILGAAVVDDVLGLIVLAVVAGIIQAVDRGETFRASSMAWIVVKALGFLIGAIYLGRQLSRRVFQVAGWLAGEGILLSSALGICFAFSWLAGSLGLAPIVGAFAAGLTLDEVYYRNLLEKDSKNRSILELLEPLSTFLVPVFFVLMGTRVDLSVFADLGVLAFAAVLTVAAILGKQACGAGVVRRGVDRIAVGIGMVPRGEVGLIFASIGAGLTVAGRRVVDDHVFSAVVLMVAVTTMVTPPLLVWRMRRTRSEG
jgi:Kef-type K+ transport system membrane component KefB